MAAGADAVDGGTIDAYLERLGYASRPAPTLDSLRDLQLRHLCEVPFENLSVHLGEEVALDEVALVSKVTTRHRGGFCYELNGAFSSLLTALGFRVTHLAARVIGPEGRLGPPFDHMALRVDLDAGGLPRCLLVAPDVATVAFHRQPGLLATHHRRARNPVGAPTGHDRAGRSAGARAGDRSAGPGRVPRPFRHCAGAGAYSQAVTWAST